uniref:NB-ARC domain containing protein n=2 Tax=Oryza sativa subsp. japonica TaxID=39947 RepID=Q2R1D4_ORYSJ|nr:NB-ARC domain containing protein [Oryza sativa Japonica Group]
MADIVLGLTKSVVEGTVIKVQSAILEENQLKERVQHDLVFITDEFQMMQSFLNVVGRGQANNNVVRTWVTQKSAWWHRLFPSFMAPVLPSCLAPVLPLDEAVADIKQIKARVEDVSQRNMRYNLISDSGSKPVGPAAGGSSASDALVEVRDIAKELSGSGDLAELLTNNDGDLQVISIWETEGDHGESSIIRNVYDDPEIKRNFECLAWIKIMHPFDLSEFFQALRSQFYTNSGQQRQGAEVKLFTKFRTEVYKKRYLIVLEDLNTVSEWESIRSNLPNMRNGSRVVVSTQKVEIASLCTGHPFQVSQIRRFSYYHCVCMFFKEISAANELDRMKPKQEIKGIDTVQAIWRCKNLLMCFGSLCELRQLVSFRILLYLCCLGLFGHRLEPDGDHPAHHVSCGGPGTPPNLAEGSYRDSRSKDEKTFGCNNDILIDWLLMKDGLRQDDISSFYAKTGLVLDDMFTRLRECNKQLLFLITEAIFRSRGEFRFGVISVWGIAGVGKSTFVRTIYNSHDQFEMYGWVNVSHPFNLRDLACSLLLDLHQNGRCFLWLGEKDIDMFRTKDPIQECHKLLHKHKFLIVIDGLQSTEEWDLIKSTLLSGNSESFIIVITNEESVARHCAVEDNFVFNVNGLKADAALYLFIKEFCVLQQFGQSITFLKFTLPLLAYLSGILVYGSAHCMSDTELRLMLGKANTPGMTEEISPLLKKHGQDRLLYKQNIDLTPEMIDEAKLIIKKCGGLPKQTSRSGNRIVWCEVNSFFHEYIMSQQMDDNHIFSLQGRCSLTSQRTGRHLVIGSTWERDKIVFMSIDFSRLRSLTVFGKWESFFISDNMKLLRVLDLENASDVTNDDLERVVSLPRLKFLSLRGCKMVSRLPDSLGGLRQLQTLDIRHTSIVRLPTVIVKLHKLQYIRGGTKVTLGEEGTSASLAAAETETQPKCRSTHALLSWLPDLCRGRHAGDPCSGIEVPRGIEELTALHTLGVVNVGVAGGKAFLKELKNLTQLRKLGVSGINWKNIQELCSAVSCHRYLESLSVRLDKDEHGSSDDRLKEDLRNRIAEHPNKLVLKLKME